MDEHLNQLLAERHEVLLSAMTGINDRLDMLNGRTRTNERHIAVLYDRQKLLWGGMSTVAAAFAAWLVERFRS